METHEIRGQKFWDETSGIYINPPRLVNEAWGKRVIFKVVKLPFVVKPIQMSVYFVGNETV